MTKPDSYAIPAKPLIKAFDVLQVMFAGGALGTKRSDVMKAAKLSQSDTTRYLAQLAQLGVVEQVPDTDHWRPGWKWSQFARTQLQAVTREKDAIAEFEQRISRTR